MAGTILAVIGAIIIVLALIHHFVANSFLNFGHSSGIILGVVGVVVLIVGVVIMQMGRGKKA